MAGYVGYEDILDDDLDFLEIIDYGFPRKIYTRQNPFKELDDLGFYRRYRLTKKAVLNFLPSVEPELEFPSDINNSISPINQLLACLRFYASASHLQLVADDSGMHVSTLSRIVQRVSRAIARLCPDYIKMPSTDEHRRIIQNKFFDIASFPRVLGVIDGTHIKIQSPGGNDPEIFRNRKTYFSVNVQAVSDSDLNILDLVARWPGSAHDATIYNNSQIKARFENGEFGNSLLLGDSGYPIRSYFLTPLRNPVTRGQQLYNESLIRTRNAAERLFGCWKRRFPVLAYGIRLKLETVLTIIVATGILHNLALQMNLEEPPVPEGTDPHELEILIANGQIPRIPVGGNIVVNNVRDDFINNYFANL